MKFLFGKGLKKKWFMKTIFSFLGILVVISSIVIGVILLKKDFFFEFMVKRNFSQYPHGTLCLDYKNGNIEKYGINSNKNSKCDATIIINNSTEFFRMVASAGGGIGLGEAYFEGMWETNKNDEESLSTVVYHLFKNQISFPITKRRIQFLLNSFLEYKTLIHWLERIFKETKTLENDARDIEYHYDKGYTFNYDISTEFWESYLGKTRSGSCAIWNNNTKTLDDAQNNKWNIIINKLEINSNDNVLDVGSGWGYLCNKINIDKGANCTGITLSKDQLEASKLKYNSNLCENKNMDEIKKNGCIKFILLDYRFVEKEFGKNYFTKIVSVGMVEHVGYKRIQEYFNVLTNVLKINGKMLIHGITMDDIYHDYMPVTRNKICKNTNFISKYIFPGGCILHPDYMIESALKSGLEIIHRENYGKHYAITLNIWLKNMRKNWPNLKNQNNLDIRFFKLHEFYFTFCEAVFRTSRCELTHFLFFKPKENYDATFYYKNEIRNPNTC